MTTSEKTLIERKAISLDPYIIYDLKNSQEIDEEIESSINGSLYNPKEAEFVLGLSRHLVKITAHSNLSIGIITPYQRQVQYLKEIFEINKLGHIEIDTVDSYQGREKNIIIFSCVRANGKENIIGFLNNRQHLNVSLTRAINGLYIVCHAETLKSNKYWNMCIKDAEQRNLVRTVVG